MPGNPLNVGRWTARRRDVLRWLAAGAVAPAVEGGSSLLRTVTGGGGAWTRATDDDLDPPGRTSQPISVEPHTLVALELPRSGRAWVRRSRDGARFGPWVPAPTLETEREGPDQAESSRGTGRWASMSEALWTGSATTLQVRVTGADPDRLGLTVLDGSPARGAAPADAAAPSGGAATAATLTSTAPRDDPDDGSTDDDGTDDPDADDDNSTDDDPDIDGTDEDPNDAEGPDAEDPDADDDEAGPSEDEAEEDDPDPPPDTSEGTAAALDLVTRADWYADESLNNGEPAYGRDPVHIVVHHTVNSNEYTSDESPAIVRSIHHYHTETQGWNDVGYNLLIDRYGTIFEGRGGGVDEPVIGAHAAGFNDGSKGVSLIGDFAEDILPWAMYEALVEVVTHWCEVHRIEPRADVENNGVEIPAIGGHRDVGSTECPGSVVYNQLANLRDDVAERAQLAEPAPPPFSDVAGHPHERDIGLVAAAEIAGGYKDGTFRPNDPVTRGQMATLLTRAEGYDTSGENGWPDVADDHAHHDGIMGISYAGITGGYDDGTYRPNETVTRAQMATFLSRARDMAPATGQSFPDVPPSHTHHPGIESAALVGVARGFGDGDFRPEQPVTRGQMCTFIARAYGL